MVESGEAGEKGYQVVILDHHPSADARIDKHIRFLLENGIPTYRVNFNKYSSAEAEGEFSLHGEKAYMIDVHREGSEFTTNLHLDLYFLSTAADDALDALRQMGLEDRGDIVLHLHNHPMLPIASKLRRRLEGNIHIVFDRHESNEVGPAMIGVPASVYGRRFEYPWRGCVEGVVAVTDDIKDFSEVAFPQATVVKVPNYPELGDFDVAEIERKIDALGEDTRVVLSYIGSLNNEFDRDVDLMLRMADELISEGEDVEFVLGGRHAPEPLLDRISAMCDRHPSRFVFLGEVHRPIVVEVTTRSHFTMQLLKPDTEYWVKGSSNKVYEGLYCGCVLLARANLDDADLIDDCSLIFGRDDDPSIIVDAVRELLHDRGRMGDMMRKAHERGGDFTWDNVAPRYLELYDRVLGR